MKKNNQTSWRPFLIWALLIVFTWLGFHFFADWLYPIKEEVGQMGDKYGALNTLFSGLAFAALVYTIKLQREDLKLTVKELAKTAKAQETTALLMEKQAIDLDERARISIMPIWGAKLIKISKATRQIDIELELQSSIARYIDVSSTWFGYKRPGFGKKTFSQQDSFRFTLTAKHDFKTNADLRGSEFKIIFADPKGRLYNQFFKINPDGHLDQDFPILVHSEFE